MVWCVALVLFTCPQLVCWNQITMIYLSPIVSKLLNICGDSLAATSIYYPEIKYCINLCMISSHGHWFPLSIVLRTREKPKISDQA